MSSRTVNPWRRCSAKSRLTKTPRVAGSSPPWSFTADRGVASSTNWREIGGESSPTARPPLLGRRAGAGLALRRSYPSGCPGLIPRGTPRTARNGFPASPASRSRGRANAPALPGSRQGRPVVLADRDPAPPRCSEPRRPRGRLRHRRRNQPRCPTWCARSTDWRFGGSSRSRLAGAAPPGPRGRRRQFPPDGRRGRRAARTGRPRRRTSRTFGWMLSWRFWRLRKTGSRNAR